MIKIDTKTNERDEKAKRNETHLVLQPPTTIRHRGKDRGRLAGWHSSNEVMGIIIPIGKQVACRLTMDKLESL